MKESAHKFPLKFSKEFLTNMVQVPSEETCGKLQARTPELHLFNNSRTAKNTFPQTVHLYHYYGYMDLLVVTKYERGISDVL